MCHSPAIVDFGEVSQSGPRNWRKGKDAMKTRTGGAIASIIFALALAVGLTACGGGKSDGGDSAANFVGVWQLEAMEGEEEISTSDIEMMAEMDMFITLTLAEGGDAVMDFMGDANEGTWKVKDASTVTLTFEGESADGVLKDGKLKMTQDGTTLVFAKTDKDPAKTAAVEEKEEGEDEVVVEEEEVVEEAPVSSGDAIDIQYGVPFGDDIATITVIDSAVDFGDDPGYNLKVENNSDQAVIISYKSGTFSVGGKMVSPGLYETVQPGKYVETFMYFGNDDVADLAALVDVEGVIEITSDTWDVLTEFDVKFPDGQ